MFLDQQVHNRHLIILSMTMYLLFWGSLYLLISILLGILYSGVAFDIQQSIFHLNLSYAYQMFELTITVIIITLWFLVSQMYEFFAKMDKVIPAIIKNYDAKLIRNHDEYPILMDTVEAISVGLGIDMPEIYLIHDDKSKPVLNTMSFNDENNQALFVTQSLMDQLNPYELEAVLAISLSSIANGYQKVKLINYLTHFDTKKITILFLLFGLWPTINLIKAMIAFANAGINLASFTYAIPWLSFVPLLIPLIMVWCAQIYQTAYQLNNKRYLKKLNTFAIQLTSDPQALIAGLTKIKNSPNYFHDLNNQLTSRLWLNPNPLNYHQVSVADQLKVLKTF